MQDANLVLKVEHVSKKIGNEIVLSDVNLEVVQQQIVGLVGRNGSGKTMLFRIVCGLVRPSSGRVVILGKELANNDSLPQDIGAIIEQPGFLPQYSGMRNLKLLAAIRNVINDEEIASVMRSVGLDPNSRKPVRAYSLGMRQRLGIAQAIMERPKLLMLDEPTNGLDAEGIRIFRDLVLRLRNEEGTTILMSSHYAEDISALCDKVFHMERGQLAQLETGVLPQSS